MSEYEWIRQVREQEAYRNSFFELAKEVFGLSFRGWYENGFWTDRYIPYCLADGSRIVANASANVIDTLWQGERKRYIQIGTVMTHPAYRKRGLMKRIMEQLLADWKGRCDGIYLYANDSVLDFYPKFGFETAQEYGHRIDLSGGGQEKKGQDGMWRKLDMAEPKDRELLRSCYGRSNPYSALPMLDNEGLLMFYCADFMKECVYYSRRWDTVCVAAGEEEAVYLSDVFGNPACSLYELAAGLPFEHFTSVVLGFTPKDDSHCSCERLVEEDTTLFVLSGGENVFSEGRLRMPELSRA